MLPPGLLLKYSQFVNIYYNIILFTNGNHCFITRVMVDNVENRIFRVITANTAYHSHSQSQKVWMEAGLHYVRVEFRNDGLISNQGLGDWNGAFFKLDHYEI